MKKIFKSRKKEITNENDDTQLIVQILVWFFIGIFSLIGLIALIVYVCLT